MKTEAEIDKLIAAGLNAELEGLDFVKSFDYATLCREYNGIGPEWAGGAARQFVTRRLSIFEPPTLIHDLRNFKSDGSRKAFHAANDEFLHNCLKIINAHYHEDEKKYAKARVAVFAMYAFVDGDSTCYPSSLTSIFAMYAFVDGDGGWKAWIDCHERNLSHETSDIGHQTR